MSGLTLFNRVLNLIRPKQHAEGYESNAPTGVSLSDIAGMEDLLLGVRTHSGQTVTPERAKRCATVLAIMRGISEDISALPLPLYKRGEHGDELATNHADYALLDSSPNDVMTSMEVREHILWDMMLTGNFFVQKIEDPNRPGEIASLWPLQAALVTRRYLQLVWTYSDPLTGIGGSFSSDAVWRGTVCSANGLDGVGLTLLAREAIGLLLAAEEQGARLFSQGIQSDLTLSTADTLDADSKKDLRSALMARHAGSSNAFMPLLLEGGLTAARIGLTAQESQYIESRKFQIEDIARVFRYPEVLLGTSSGKSATYASAEQFFGSYVKHTLTPWAVRIEQTANRDLLAGLDKNRYFFRHDFSALLRGDTAARYASYTSGITGGFMQPEEARRKENMPYMPGLDYFVKVIAPNSAGPNTPPTKPTDESAQDELPRRVASVIFKKERRALVGQKQDADAFYSNFGAAIEELTGADHASILLYLEMRRETEDRFSPEAQDHAISTLTQLCKG